MKRYVLAITGASGSVIGIRVLGALLKISEVHLVISSQSFPIIRHETGVDWTKTRGRGQGARTEKEAKDREQAIRRYFKTDRLFYYEDKNMAAPIASGSFLTDGMLVVPCSMKTLSGIASGYANNLIERTADVAIKEGRPLLLSPREMPFSAIHLENMLKLARLGVRIAPPVPAFYHQPDSLNDIIDFIAGKILDSFGVKNDLFKRWGS